MKKVVLLSTGGTIASKEDPQTGLMMAGEQSGEELLAQCKRSYIQAKNIEVEVHSIFQIPSNQMTFAKCLDLLVRMEKLLAESHIDGFVVTHGTDTLEESAYFLSLYWKHDIALVFTGAQFSPTERNTDAFHNITNAILVAAEEKSKDAGVTVLFNDRIFPAQYASKYHASNIDGFHSSRTGPLGIVDFGRVHYFQYPAHREHFSFPIQELKKVEIIKSYVGMDTGVFTYHIENGAAGLVVEAFGRGHVDLPTAQKIMESVQKGVAVVITSGCSDGELAEVYGFKGGLHDLIEKGGINGHDYAAKKARIKLIALLTDSVQMSELQSRFDDY